MYIKTLHCFCVCLQMAQNPQTMLAQGIVADVCARSLAEVEAVTQQLQTPLEVPVMNSDTVRIL